MSNNPSDILKAFNKAINGTDKAEDDDSILDIDTAPEGASDAQKSMTSRSMPTLNSYIQRGVYANATTPVTRANTRLNPPEGRAPHLTPTITHNTGSDYQSCGAHGTTYKSTSSCQHCFISKGYSCNDCGGDLMKNAGGCTTCQKCGA